MLHLVLMLLHNSNLHREMYDLHDEDLVHGRLGIHQLLPECDHRLTLVHHLISSRHHPLLDQEMYGLEGEGLIRGVVHYLISSRYHPLLDQEVYGLGEEGLIRGVVHHLISSQYHPLLDQEVYGLEGEGLIREGLGIHMFLEMHHRLTLAYHLFRRLLLHLWRCHPPHL